MVVVRPRGVARSRVVVVRPRWEVRPMGVARSREIVVRSRGIVVRSRGIVFRSRGKVVRSRGIVVRSREKVVRSRGIVVRPRGVARLAPVVKLRTHRPTKTASLICAHHYVVLKPERVVS
jgi:hypothetical protein